MEGELQIKVKVANNSLPHSKGAICNVMRSEQWAHSASAKFVLVSARASDWQLCDRFAQTK